MNESEISKLVKCSISIELEVPSESIRYLPGSVAIRFDRKKERTH